MVVFRRCRPSDVLNLCTRRIVKREVSFLSFLSGPLTRGAVLARFALLTLDLRVQVGWPAAGDLPTKATQLADGTYWSVVRLELLSTLFFFLRFYCTTCLEVRTCCTYITTPLLCCSVNTFACFPSSVFLFCSLDGSMHFYEHK